MGIERDITNAALYAEHARTAAEEAARHCFSIDKKLAQIERGVERIFDMLKTGEGVFLGCKEDSQAHRDEAHSSPDGNSPPA